MRIRSVYLALLLGVAPFAGLAQIAPNQGVSQPTAAGTAYSFQVPGAALYEFSLGSGYAVPVTSSNPLDVKCDAGCSGGSGGAGGSNAAAGATGSAVPGSASYEGFANGSGALTGVSAGNPLPVTGNVGITGNVAVTGAYQATQPVSVANTLNVQGVSGGTALPVSGTFYQTTQPVSLASTVNVQGVSGGTSIPVSGTFYQATQPVSGTVNVGNFPATQPVSAATPLNVQGVAGGTAVPISAASLPLPAGAATAANQNSSAAGTSAANAQGVQGVTGGVPVPVTPPTTTTAGSTNANFDQVGGINGSGVAVPTLIGTQAFTATVASGTATIIPAAAGKRFYITGVSVVLSESSSLASQGDVVFTLLDGTTTVLTNKKFIATTGVSSYTSAINIFPPLTGLQYISNSANQALTFSVSTAISGTAAGANITIFGGYTTATP